MFCSHYYYDSNHIAVLLFDFVFLFKSQNTSEDEKLSNSTVSKSTKSSLKRPRTPEIPATTDALNVAIDEDDEPKTKQYNFSMSVDELSDMEKEVNDFCNEDEDDDDDDTNDASSRPAKQQRTSGFAPITTTDNLNDDDDNNYDSDSSSSQKLRDLILGKKPETDSDDEILGDDDAPRGWKDNQKLRKRKS